MNTLLAGLLMFLLAWLWDRLLRSGALSEPVRVGFVVPLGEEIIKFLVARWFLLPIPLVSLIFGFIEGLYETWTIRRGFDWRIMLAGTITHALLGAVYFINISLGYKLGLAILLHMAWNSLIIRKNNHNNGSN